MALLLTDLVLGRQKCRFFDVEHKGGNKHSVHGTVIRLAELAYSEWYGWLNCMWFSNLWVIRVGIWNNKEVLFDWMKSCLSEEGPGLSSTLKEASSFGYYLNLDLINLQRNGSLNIFCLSKGNAIVCLQNPKDHVERTASIPRNIFSLGKYELHSQETSPEEGGGWYLHSYPEISLEWWRIMVQKPKNTAANHQPPAITNAHNPFFTSIQ